MQAEPRKAGTISETREGQFVCSNGSETAKRDWQRLPVKQRDAEQCQGKKNEIERNSEDQNGFSQCGLDPYTLACRFPAQSSPEWAPTGQHRPKPPFPAMHARLVSRQVHIKICDLQCAPALKSRRLSENAISAKLCRHQFQFFLVPIRLCLDQRGVVDRRLFRIRHGKRGERIVHRFALAHVARDDSRIARPRMGPCKSTAAHARVIRKRLQFTDLADPAEPMVLQRADVELTAGFVVLRVTKKNIARGLHHLLTFHDTLALMPDIGYPPAEALQYRTLRLLELQEQRFAVASHQQRDVAIGANRPDADGLERKIHDLVAVEDVTPVSPKTLPVHGKSAISIEFMRHMGTRLEVEDRRRFVGNSKFASPDQTRKIVILFEPLSARLADDHRQFAP